MTGKQRVLPSAPSSKKIKAAYIWEPWNNTPLKRILNYDEQTKSTRKTWGAKNRIRRQRGRGLNIQKRLAKTGREFHLSGEPIRGAWYSTAKKDWL